MKDRTTYSPEQKTAILEKIKAHKKSGMTLAAALKAEHIYSGMYHSWARKFGAKKRPYRKRAPTLVTLDPIQPAPEPVSGFLVYGTPAYVAQALSHITRGGA